MSRINSIITIAPRGEEEGIPRYPDTGCELAPRCLECPLPLCRFDTVDGRQWRRRPKGIPNKRRGKGQDKERQGDLRSVEESSSFTNRKEDEID